MDLATTAARVLPVMGGRRIIPRGLPPQAVARSLLAAETFSTPAQRALEQIANEAEYAKRVRYTSPDSRVLVFPRAPNPDDSVAAIRELGQLNLAPEFLRYFPDDPIPRRMAVPFGETPLSISEGPQGWRVREAMAEQGRYTPRILAGVARGALQGMPTWYGTQQLADLVGPGNMRRFGEGMAVATHGRDPVKNARAATFMMRLMEDPQFLRMAEGLDWSKGDEAAAALKAAFPYPEGLDSFASRNDYRAAAEHVLSRQNPEFLDVLDVAGRGAGKRQFFGHNLLGNYDPYTGDRHEYAARGFAERRKGITDPELDAAEWQKELGSTSHLEAMNLIGRQIGSELGLYPAEVQEMRWVGDAGLTGVKPYIDADGQSGILPSLIHGIEDRIRRLRGTDPSTESGLRRGRSIMRKALSGEIILPAMAAPLLLEDE
jgi:hypothetical protein